MSRTSDIYARGLFHYGHGFPVWDPQPTDSGEVLIGDVGYMEDGQFFRLFNAMRPADDPVNQRWGVPDGFVPLTVDPRSFTRRDGAIPAGPLCSRSVVSNSIDAQVSA